MVCPTGISNVFSAGSRGKNARSGIISGAASEDGGTLAAGMGNPADVYAGPSRCSSRLGDDDKLTGIEVD